MAKIIVEMYFPTLTVDDLKDLVVANDSSEDDVPIARENVEPHHVVDLIDAHEFPDVEVTSSLRFEETW